MARVFWGKASFSCSEHERLCVFEILVLQTTNTTQKRCYYTTKNTAYACARERKDEKEELDEKERDERKGKRKKHRQKN